MMKGHPVLLQHGLLDDGFTWLVPSWKNTLVKKLTDDGFEVWIMNSRGTRYSHEHEKMSSKSKKYWKFSFHEMGMYDQPANVDYIKKVSGAKKIHAYVGHSQGTTQMFAKLSMDPSFHKNFDMFVGLAPAAYAGNQESKLISLAEKLHVELFWKLIGDPKFLYLSNKQVSPL